MHERLTSEAEILVCFSLRPAVVKIQGRRKLEMHRMIPNWTWNTLQSKLIYIQQILSPEAQILVCFGLRVAVPEIQARPKSEMHRMIPKWTWTLNSQKYSIYTNYILTPEVQISVRFAMNQRFSRYKVVGNRKCTEWQQNELEHLTVKRTLYALYTYPWGQILVRFALWLAVSEIQARQNQKYTEWPQTELEHLTVKGTLDTLHAYSWGPNFGSFRSTTCGFQDIAQFVIPHWLLC